MTGDLTLPGTWTETGLSLPQDISYDDVVRVWETIHRFEQGIHWWRGDFLVFLEEHPKYGDTYSQFLDPDSGKYQTLAMERYVASRVKLFRRLNNLSWSMHLEVASLPDEQQEAFLSLACEADPRWTVAGLRQAVREWKAAQREAAKLERDEAKKKPKARVTLNEEARDDIYERHAAGETYASIAEDYGLSDVRALQVYKEEEARRERLQLTLDAVPSEAAEPEAEQNEDELVEEEESETGDEPAPQEASSAAPAAVQRFQVFQGDCFAFDAAFAGEPFDLIVTDPPYKADADAVALCEQLARHANRWLKPGGSLLVMMGQMYLPAVLHRMAAHLFYRWTLAYLTPGGQAVQIWPHKVNTFWKPILWFTNGPFDGEWVGDVTKSAVNDNDKRHHEWGQSESGMADLVARFVKAGDRVLDPFMGAGTTGVVALHAGCRFVGVDRDGKNVQTAADRLAQEVSDG